MFRINLDDIKHFNFPAGEVHLNLSEHYKAYSSAHIKLICHLRSSNDILKMMLCVDALREMDCPNIHLVIPYVPYSQQDRCCVKGEPHSSRAFARLINSLNVDKVTIYDPHSNVISALLNNCKVINTHNFVWFVLQNFFEDVVLIAPDAGAEKKVFDLAQTFNKQYYVARKVRDVKTGNILQTIFHDDVTNKDCIMCDDACQGGKTFEALAAVLKAQGARSVHLIVSHGIFSKGLEPLYAAGVDTIWTTDSYYLDDPLRGLNLDSKERVYKLYNEI